MCGEHTRQTMKRRLERGVFSYQSPMNPGFTRQRMKMVGGPSEYNGSQANGLGGRLCLVRA